MGRPEIGIPGATSFPALTVDEVAHLRRHAELLRTACRYLTQVSDVGSTRIDVVFFPIGTDNSFQAGRALGQRLAEEYGLICTTTRRADSATCSFRRGKGSMRQEGPDG